jgi:phosphoglycolate phosphatase
LPEDRRNEDTIRRCLDEYREDYGKHWSVETRPYPGVPELLDALRRRGLKLAVLSNKPDAFTKKCVAALLPRDAFDAVAGERPDVPRKPDPAGARAMATQFGAAPGDCLYVGDSGIDMKTAVGAGMFPVGVLWGFRPREEMEASGARVLVAAPTEILNLLDR